MRALITCFVIAPFVALACTGSDPDVTSSTDSGAPPPSTDAGSEEKTEATVDAAPNCPFNDTFDDPTKINCPGLGPYCITKCCIGDTSYCVDDGGSCPAVDRAYECESPQKCGDKHACCISIGIGAQAAAQECSFVTYADFGGSQCSLTPDCPSGSFAMCKTADDCAKGKRCQHTTVQIPVGGTLEVGLCL